MYILCVLPVNVLRSLVRSWAWRFGKQPTRLLIQCPLQLSLTRRYALTFFRNLLNISPSHPLLSLSPSLPPSFSLCRIFSSRCFVYTVASLCLHWVTVSSPPYVISQSPCQTPWKRALSHGTLCGTIPSGMHGRQLYVVIPPFSIPWSNPHSIPHIPFLPFPQSPWYEIYIYIYIVHVYHMCIHCISCVYILYKMGMVTL